MVKQHFSKSTVEARGAHDPQRRNVERTDHVLGDRTQVGSAVNLAFEFPLLGARRQRRAPAPSVPRVKNRRSSGVSFDAEAGHINDRFDITDTSDEEGAARQSRCHALEQDTASRSEPTTAPPHIATNWPLNFLRSLALDRSNARRSSSHSRSRDPPGPATPFGAGGPSTAAALPCRVITNTSPRSAR